MSLIKLNKNNKWMVITTIHVLISKHKWCAVSRCYSTCQQGIPWCEVAPPIFTHHYMPLVGHVHSNFQVIFFSSFILVNIQIGTLRASLALYENSFPPIEGSINVFEWY